MLLSLVPGPRPARAAAQLDCPEARSLCVQSDHTGTFDLKGGVAQLDGNVLGFVRNQALTFTGDALKVYRGEDQGWRRMLLDDHVSLLTPQRFVKGDHGIFVKGQYSVQGNVRMAQEKAWARSDEMVVDRADERATFTGTAARPVQIQFGKSILLAQIVAPDARATHIVAESGPEVPLQRLQLGDSTFVQARKAVVEERTNQVLLTGAVQVDMTEHQLNLNAQSVTLLFAEDRTITGFLARGDVVIVQPGRRLTADSARSQNHMQTILLQGRARLRQEGQYALASEQLEVYTDAKKGTVHSRDRQRPFTLSLDLSNKKPWKLDKAGANALAKKGVPGPTLNKLQPVVDYEYTTQEELRRAIVSRLTPEESQRYLATILSQAQHP